MLADDAPWLVPVQPPQELRLSLRIVGDAVLPEPAQRAKIGDDELARENPRRRGRSREESLGGVDPAVVAPAAAAMRFPATAE